LPGERRLSDFLVGECACAELDSTARLRPGFEPAEPDLEDVYFSTMAGHMGRRHAQPEPEVVP
jgi:hypothetical protein